MLTYLLRSLFPERKSKRLLADARRLFQAGSLDEAERMCAASGEFSSDPAEIHHLRGLIALERKQPELAVRYLEAAVEEDDANASFHLALARAYQKLEQHERAAFQFARTLERLPLSDPNRTPIMLDLAAELTAWEEFEAAERCYREILEIEPDNLDALLLLAVTRFQESDPKEARALLDRYIALRPGAAQRLRRALMLPRIFESNEEIESERKRLEQELDELLDSRLPAIPHPEREVGTTAFLLAYHGRNNSALLRKLGRVCRSLYPARTECDRRPGVSGRRLRIGFVSTFFHFHSVARTTIGLIRDLPRSHFEVYVFAIAPSADEWAEAIRRSADHYVSLPADLDRVREAIDSEALDMLLFADIGMHPLTYFLALWRLAPIQLVTWGHSVTSGVDTVDYYVSSDAIEAQGSEDQYTEKLIRLPGYFMPRYRRPVLDAPRKSREQLGLPADAHVYCCPQSLFKLHPDFDAALRAILERDPRAGILLIESRKSLAKLLRKRFLRTLGPAASKVHFVGRMQERDFLQYVAAADVILDPFYFGGCNSSCEALSLAVPVVTLPAFQLPGRFTMGLYQEIDMNDCVARSAEEYVDIAVRLAREPDYRKSISDKIASRCERLFDRPDTGLALGEALLRLAEAAR